MSCVPDVVRRLVIGVGNPDRGDDGVGRLVARLLRARLPDVRIEEHGGDAGGLIELFRTADDVILVDAMVSGRPPGSIVRLDCAAGDVIPVTHGASSHGFGVAEAIGLARMLGCLPARCVIFGVESEQCEIGAALCPSVAAAAQEIARSIGAEVTAQTQDGSTVADA
jgi:hydrogenase maturation protease